jgi:hypothetical protein
MVRQSKIVNQQFHSVKCCLGSPPLEDLTGQAIIYTLCVINQLKAASTMASTFSSSK